MLQVSKNISTHKSPRFILPVCLSPLNSNNQKDHQINRQKAKLTPPCPWEIKQDRFFQDFLSQHRVPQHIRQPSLKWGDHLGHCFSPPHSGSSTSSPLEAVHFSSSHPFSSSCLPLCSNHTASSCLGSAATLFHLQGLSDPKASAAHFHGISLTSG